ncbi:MULTISPECIES: hypothetical protein [unclassified Variovorax]|uniref:hypothetical protein n=1 Tax=unclassified Variovorax TaxID=663243 RepID=UPI0008382B2E|nr:MULTISPECIES: hypothetical protein [unclassified Variovorax]PNG50120.1 hypothetical protein CHC06_05743 [Variovorax sp. B2]PNG50993.1 hypothetical protein CHC07_05649 [Variovorax sp. B4]VTV17157.1 hypothetical protein WDL1P1_00158 [Variovorax sp. WDL1]
MHTIPPYQPGVTLRHRSGASYEYPSLEAAFRALGYWWLSQNLGLDFTSPFYCSRLLSWVTADWMMVTDFGAPVVAADFERFRGPPRRPFWASKHDYCGYGPVPGTGRRHGGHHFRRVHHINERRSAVLVLQEDGEVAPRGKRAAANLPTPWDDYAIAAREDRSWKLCRKTRWKVRS